MKKLLCGLTLVLVSGGLASVGLSSPAAAACVAETEWAAYLPSDASRFNASVNCNGVLAAKPAPAAEVRGWYNDGTWRQSSYQWVLIGSSAGKKIVGQTIDGRLCRVEGHYDSFYIAASY